MARTGRVGAPLHSGYRESRTGRPSDCSPEGHSEVLFRNVRVPAANLLGKEGDGFMMAQARLGPGRVHHCMRAIGMAELGLELMVARSRERKTFGKYLHQHGPVAEWIARSRIEIEQVRGVACNYSLSMLLERGLIVRKGRKKTLGSPMLYVTNDEFLRHFGIETIKDLPALKLNE